MSEKKHIATMPCYGMFGRRIGTHYLYSAQGIKDYQKLCAERYGKNPAVRWRNDKVRKETLAGATT